MIRTFSCIIGLIVFAALSTAQTTQPAMQPAMQPAAAPPATPDEAIAHARTLFDSKQTGEALDLAKRVLQQFPTHTGANLLAAEILLRQPDLDLARTYYMRVLDNEPLNFRANLGVGKIWVMSRYFRQATKYLEDAEGVAPTDQVSEVKRLLAVAYAEIGRYDDGIEKALQSINADPEDLDSWRTLVGLRLRPLEDVTRRDQFAGEITRALEDSQSYVDHATKAVCAEPWKREQLAVVNDAYQLQMQSVEILHQSYYQRRGQSVTDKLQSGKGTQAADALNRMAELRRKYAVLQLILNEHDNLLLLAQAVGDDYDPKNVKYLENLANTCLQLEDLTARAFGPEVLQDKTMRDQAAEAFRAILEIQPEHERALKFMAAQVGVENSAATAATAQP